MILGASVLLAVLVGLVRGGSLERLAQLPLRTAWAAVLAFGLQIYLIYFPEPMSQGPVSLRVGVLVASYLLLLWFIWLNRRLPGIVVIGAGLIANLSVMLLNGGYMPITVEALTQVGHARNVQSSGANARVLATKDVVLPRELTIAWWLSDVFVLAPPFPIPSVFSLGDVLIAAGAFWLVQGAMLAPAKMTAAAGSVSTTVSAHQQVPEA